MVNKTYFTQRDYNNSKKINDILENDLPDFCHEYFIGIEQRTTTLTRLNYAYDIRLFCYYLITETKDFLGKDVKSIEIESLEKLPSYDIEKYISFLTYYSDKNDNVNSNSDKAKARKLSSIRAMFKFFIKKERISRDPTASVEMPKIHNKEIIRLDENEIVDMLKIAETGNGMTKRQFAYHKNTATRDYAMVSLFLGTGIRVSELVGIDLNDVNFNDLSFVVTRKGGNRVKLYYSEEIAGALYDYYQMRISDKNTPENEKALFISGQKKRITTRAVENVIKKYSSIAVPQKKITPHKLRSTFGTQLYRQTGDIYVVADVLGHKDVNTTKKHYAAISDDIRRKASTEIVLRTKIDDENK